MLKYRTPAEAGSFFDMLAIVEGMDARMTATPWGFRDILPEEAQAREEIAQTVRDCFRAHHYLPVETPLLEDKGSLEEGGRIADTPVQVV